MWNLNSNSLVLRQYMRTSKDFSNIELLLFHPSTREPRASLSHSHHFGDMWSRALFTYRCDEIDFHTQEEERRWLRSRQERWSVQDIEHRWDNNNEWIFWWHIRNWCRHWSYNADTNVNKFTRNQKRRKSIAQIEFWYHHAHLPAYFPQNYNSYTPSPSPYGNLGPSNISHTSSTLLMPQSSISSNGTGPPSLVGGPMTSTLILPSSIASTGFGEL